MQEHNAQDEGNECEEIVEGEDLGNFLSVGDNFGVPAMDGNNKRVGFYALKCTKASMWFTKASSVHEDVNFNAVTSLYNALTIRSRTLDMYLLETLNRPILMHILWCMDILQCSPNEAGAKGGEVTYNITKDIVSTICPQLDHRAKDEVSRSLL